MFGLIKKMFIVLLTSLVNASNHTKCISLSNQKCMIQPTLINLHPNENTQGLHYYPFVVNLDKCVGNCNTLNDLPNKLCVLYKTEDLNLSIEHQHELKILAKHISCEYKCKFDGRNVIQVKGGIMINVNKSAKNIIYVKKIMFGILLHIVAKMANI